ncbi:MAG: hypothetical protein J1E06_00515 [Acutalibacter sp.]|nr:hypothetical protein [Acutalibacter sp.]
MKLSFSHLFRSPVKTLLFFLLMTGCTVLLVSGSVLTVQANRRIAAAEQEFSTIGTAEQLPETRKTAALQNSCYTQGLLIPAATYDKIIPVEVLAFEGANYVEAPEKRACYLSYIPGLNQSSGSGGFQAMYIMEFSPLEDWNEYGPAEVTVERLLYGRRTMQAAGSLESAEEGNTITLCNHFCRELSKLEVGKRYIAAVYEDYYTFLDEGRNEYVIYTAPFSTQFAADGIPAESDRLEMANNFYGEGGTFTGFTDSNAIAFTPWPNAPVYAEEITEDFYREGGRGEIWQNWAEELEKQYKDRAYFYVLPTNSLETLSVFHNDQVVLKQGRMITQEEFHTGSAVCMLPDSMLMQNLLNVGDKLPLELVCSLHGGWQVPDVFGVAFSGTYSTLNADGQPYQPFWKQEYEIVGTYDVISSKALRPGTGELTEDMLIIPSASVQASDVDNVVFYAPMAKNTTSFQIPNGSIEEFERKLREAVPDADGLAFTFDDQGYSDVMTSLRTARMNAILLLILGALAAAAILILLLYFFIVKQEKRTAIERSLGMTKRQCKMSLLAGILALTVAACVLGSAGTAILTEYAYPAAATEEWTDAEEFNTAYSLWAKRSNAREELQITVSTPVLAYLAAPLLQFAAVLILSLLLSERNLKRKSIELLSTKEE